MRERLKNRKLQVWVDSEEFSFLLQYSKKSHLTISELIRGWIHEVMKREGYEIKEPSLPEQKPKKGGK
ncbi:MAG: hypothetical protein ACM3SR_01960 [Ignavibacteriales bacterium]